MAAGGPEDLVEKLDLDWAAVVEGLPQRVLLLDAGLRVQEANRAARIREQGLLVGRRCHEVLRGQTAPCADCSLAGGGRDSGERAEVLLCGLMRSPAPAGVGRLAVLVEPGADASGDAAAGAGSGLLSMLLHGALDAAVATDPDGRILVFNDGASRLLGHEPDAVVGQKRLADLFPPDGASEALKQLRSPRFGGKGRLVSFRTRCLTADGAAIPVSLWASRLFDPDGELATLWFFHDQDPQEKGPYPDRPGATVSAARPSALGGIATRIAEQIRSPASGMLLLSNLLVQQLVRRELHRADAFLWNLIQSSVDAIIATDMRGNIFIFNDEAERTLGYRAEELVGKAHITKIYAIDEAREVMRRLRSEGYGGKGKLLGHDMELTGRQGQRVPVRLNASIVYVSGTEFATVGFFKDQRERLRMKEELQRAQVQLLQSEKMASVGKLAAGIAHQINNPLSGIVLFSNLLLERASAIVDPSVAEDLRRIADDADRCSAIVKELLEFARQTQDRPKPVDLNRALSQTVFLLEKQPLFHNIEVVKDLAPGEAVVSAEPQQINHILMNLILNAAEAMDGRGALTLRTRKTPDGEAYELEVADTGCGIPEEIRSKVFEPFFTTKEVGKGTGLGLSVVYGIVERYRGRIRIESEVGGGTSFIVTLPIGEPEME